MKRRVLGSLILLAMIGISACSTEKPEGEPSANLPDWVTSLNSPRGLYRAVGFGQGNAIPEAIRNARRNALLQIIDSSFGESVRYLYRREQLRTGFSTEASVHDFFEAASKGNLVGQEVVHNAVRRAGQDYVAYVMVQVSKKDLRKAYEAFLREERARKDLRLAETRGAVLLETGHFHKALAYYRAKARKDPLNDVWWIGMGAAQYRLGQFKKALDATDHGLLLNPRSFYGYWNRSSILEQMKRYKESLESVRIACHLRPSEACTRRLTEAEASGEP